MEHFIGWKKVLKGIIALIIIGILLLIIMFLSFK